MSVILPPANESMAHHAGFLSGEVAEWFKAHAWKVCLLQKGNVGSNPTLSAILSFRGQYAACLRWSAQAHLHLRKNLESLYRDCQELAVKRIETLADDSFRQLAPVDASPRSEM